MRLYHFTSPDDAHLGSILREGKIRTTESNVSPYKTHAGPDVVWLTTDPDPEAHQGWVAHTPKDQVRFTIDIPKFRVMQWTEFAQRHSVPEFWRQSLIRAGGGGTAYKKWYVSLTPIQRSDWTTVEDLRLEKTR